MATTPPPPDRLNTPPTPLHGPKYDTYEPYSLRRSTRSTSDKHQLESESSMSPTSLETPKAKRIRSTRVSSNNLSLSSSPQTTPRKSHKRSATTVTFAPSPKPHSPTSAELSSSSQQDLKAGTSTAAPLSRTKMKSSSYLSTLGLPTPAKTPRKQPKQSSSSLTSTARVLFPQPVDDVMPTPRKTRKERQNDGFSLESFAENSEQGSKIDIFTDSVDRIPEIDENEDNPFYEKKKRGTELFSNLVESDSDGAVPVKKRRSAKHRRGSIFEDSNSDHAIRRSSRISAKRNADVDDALDHDEGMMYTFRGKKIFKRWADRRSYRDISPLGGFNEDASEMLGGGEAPSSPELSPLDRVGVKPRLLFPTEKQKRARERLASIQTSETDDEEALTEIEDRDAHDNDLTEADDIPITPKKLKQPNFQPVSPPSTRRSLRSSTRKIAKETSPSPPSPSEAPGAPRFGGRPSPFDGWQRSKAGSKATPVKPNPRKRQGSTIERSGGMISKRTRSGHY
ncbi:MAG: hypothetical protein M1834_002430 [Cirrosporium novae-zelandiae]|nr:MAG: hypothetical protein M1834_002430 [Cirrosporium novae-zelandiae]